MAATKRAFAAVFAALLFLAPALAQAVTPPPQTGPVTDDAKILSRSAVEAMTGRIAEIQHRTGFEVVVVTLHSLQAASIETWGQALGEQWAIGAGGSERSAGAILIVAPKERQVRIAVGRGLTAHLSDDLAARIVTDRILPLFKQQRYPDGILAGLDGIAAALGAGGVPVSAATPPPTLSLMDRVLPDWGWWRPYEPWLIGIGIALVGWLLLKALGGMGSGSDYYDSDSFWWTSDSGGSSSSSGGGGSFGGGASGSW